MIDRKARDEVAAAIRNYIAIIPFPSVASLLFIRRGVVRFTRRRYPRELARRLIRHWVADKMMWVPWRIVLLVCSPMVLFFQMLPDRVFDTKIKMPEQRGDLESGVPSLSSF